MLGRRIRTRSLRERRRKMIIDGIILLLALFGACILLVSQLTMIPAINIKEIEIDGNKALTERQIEKVVKNQINGYYLNLFSRSNILIFPRWGVKSQILEQLSRVSEVDVDVRGLKVIRVSVVEREPVGAWCEEEYCYLLDENGFIFAKAPSFTNQPYFEYRGDLETDGSPIRKSFLTPENFSVLENFIEVLIDINVPAESLSVINGEHYEIIFEGGGRIIFDPTDGYESIRENLALVLASNELRHEEGGRLLEIEYIDLRFGNKIFYKLE